MLSACSPESSANKDGPLAALGEKVREHREPTKIGGDVVVRLGLRKEPEEILAYGKIVSHEPTRQTRVILVTDANDIIVTFGTGSVAYWTLTDASGKLRKALRAEPGKAESYPSNSEIESAFNEQVAFWKGYLAVPDVPDRL